MTAPTAPMTRSKVGSVRRSNIIGHDVIGRFKHDRCCAYIFPVVINVPIDVSAHAQQV